MALNQYISQGTTSEQGLYESLIIESIKIYGHDIYYLPRDVVNRDEVLNEESESRFDNAYQVEVYIENTEAFEGQGNLLSKFGLEIRDEATFIIAKKRWNEAVGTPDVQIRPFEGDLIYMPLSNSFFEVSFVEHEAPFYQLNNLPVYKLQCALFEFSGEDIDTGITEIDAIMNNAFVTELTVAGVVGTFVIGEVVTQDLGGGISISGTLQYINGTTFGLIDITTSDNEFHRFVTGEFTGVTSGAIAQISAIDSMVESNVSTQNDVFQTKGDTIIDFSESNPFGEI